MASTTTNLSLVLPAFSEFNNEWHTPVNANMSIVDALFGASTGHTHSGIAGQGPQLDHTNLLNSGANTHTQIDTHIADTAQHQDTQVGTTADDKGNSALNVNTINFANATLLETATGVITVTPDASGSGGSGSSVAPQLWVDNFNDNNQPLSHGCWLTWRQSEADPQYISQDHRATLLVQAAANVQSGYVANLDGGHAPHGINQRVTLHTGTFGHTNSTPVDGDLSILWLHLLTSGQNDAVPGVLSPSSPIQAGVSAAIQLATTSGVTTVRLALSVHTLNSGVASYNTFVAPSNWEHPTSPGDNWVNLPEEYMAGIHEFALEDSTSGYTLRYYYNTGLIFSKEFTAADGAFYDRIIDLLGELASTDGDPVYGYTGFSTSYSVGDSSGTDYTYRHGCFTTASVGDLDATRTVNTPDAGSDPPVGDKTDGGTGSSSMCAAFPAWSVVYPGNFDLDGSGSGDATDWNVTGPLNAINGNSEGFAVEDTGQTNSFQILCDVPSVNGATVVSPIYPTIDNQPWPILGTNMPVPQYYDVVFKAVNANEIPTDWTQGGQGGTYYAAGDTLPVTFIQHKSAQDTRVNDTTYGHQLDVYVRGGLRLPWNAEIEVEITPQYQGDGTYVVDIPIAGFVCPAQPTIQQQITYVYDEALGTWSEVAIGTDPVLEGSIILAAISGTNIPLGRDFWVTGNGFDTAYNWAVTNGASGNALAMTGGGLTLEGIVFSRITTGQVDTGSLPTGSPPNSVNVPITGAGGAAELVYAIFQVSPRQWNDNNSPNIRVILSDTETPVILGTPVMVEGAQIDPRPPVFAPGSSSVSDDTAGASPTITVKVDYADADAEFTFPSGWDVATSALVLTAADADSVVGDAFSLTYTFGAATTLTLDAAAGVDIDVTVTNANADTLVGGQTDTVTLSQTGGGAVVGPPGVTYNAGTLIEDKTEVITIDVDGTTIETGSYVDFASDPTYFTVTNTQKPVGSPTGAPETWTVTVATIDPGADSLPSPATLQVNNPISANLGSTTVPTQQAPPPDIVDLDLQQPDSNDTQWSTVDTTPVRVYVKVNDTESSILTLSPVITGTTSVMFTSQTHVSGNQYFVLAHITDPVAGDFFQVQAENATAGDPLISVSVAQIDIISGLTIGNTDNTFSQTHEGHYFTFVIPGTFQSGTNGDNITVDFQDAGATTLLHPSATVIIDAATTDGEIQGSARFADNIDGTLIYIEVGQIAEAISETVVTNSSVTVPSEPTISFQNPFNLSENTTGVSITISGTNLSPGAEPAGQAALDYGYTFDVLTNQVLISDSASSVSFTADVPNGSAGQDVGLTIDYLGGNTKYFPSLWNITSQATGGNIAITGWEFLPSGTTEVSAGTGKTMSIQFTGADLGASNVDALETGFTIVGEEYPGPTYPTGAEEHPPAAGLLPSNRADFIPVTSATQTDTTLTVRVNIPAELSNTRLRAHFFKPTGHPLGAGEWSQPDIDSTPTAALSTNGLDHYGLTVPVGRSGTLTTVIPNGDPAQGTTRLDAARSLQGQCGLGTEGNVVVFDVRFNQALTLLPTVLVNPDPTYGVKFKNVVVTAGPNAFTLRITATMPTPGVDNTYPLGAFTTATPVVSGFKLADGTPLCAALLGASAWSTVALEQDYFITF